MSMSAKRKPNLRTVGQVGESCLPNLILITALACIGACATDPAPDVQTSFHKEVTPLRSAYSASRRIDMQSHGEASGMASPTVCTPPQRSNYDEPYSGYAELRMAPYRACLGASRGQISRNDYRAFLEDYYPLLLLVAAIESLERLEPNTETTSHRAKLESLATENAALKLICAQSRGQVYELCE